jgi:uncharacterized repeat protein (TIGR02543 family)
MGRGRHAVVLRPDPEKSSLVQYDYTFTGWAPTPAPLLADTTYKAQYAVSARHYAVTFENSDGAVLESKEWAYGSTPSYDKVPSKPDDVKASYAFNGWDHSIEVVKGPATYKAVYTDTPKEYAVTFSNYDGSVLESKVWAYGTTPTYSGALPRKPVSGESGYDFAGWFPAISAVEGPATYTAQYSESRLDNISFSKSKNRLNDQPASSTGLSGNGIAISSQGIHFSFVYAGFCNPLDHWQTIKSGGYILNTSPIRGLQTLFLKKADASSSFKIYWSATTLFSESNSQICEADSNLWITCKFNNSLPAFVKIVAQGTLDSSIDEGYLAFNEGNSYLSLSLASIPFEGGATTGTGLYAIGTAVSISAVPNFGYSFVGWYEKNTMVSSANPYSFSLSSSDVSYEARFVAGGSYCIRLLGKEIATRPSGICPVSGSGYYFSKENVSISAEPENGYGFLGWYDGDTLVSKDNPYAFTMPAKDITYVAKFAKKYHVSLSSRDEAKGSASGSGDFAYTTSVTVNAIFAETDPFNRATWYNESSAMLSAGASYTFTMPERDLSISVGFSKALSTSFLLGKYPQTVVEDTNMLAALVSATDTDSDGFLEFGADEYKEVICAPYETGYKSVSGNVTFVKGATYYFKVEPIEWRVLSGKDTTTGLVMSEKVLTNSAYYTSTSNRTVSGSTVHANNYQYSTLRAMLNGLDGSAYSVGSFAGKGFLDVAFTEMERVYIPTSGVRNSAMTTDDPSYNPYACANTSDRIFALSYQDLLNTSYGFNSSSSASDTARRGVLTDYARATGAWMSTSSSYYGNGCWWSRSPMRSAPTTRGASTATATSTSATLRRPRAQWRPSELHREHRLSAARQSVRRRERIRA